MSSTAPTDSARLFLALCPGPTVQAALAGHAAAWHWNDEAVRYAPPDWHVTLHFIGAVPRARIGALRAALEVPMQPFELRFGTPALWPHGLAVLLPMATPTPLQQLHDALGQRLRQAGLRTDERPYRPHLTLARVGLCADGVDWRCRGALPRAAALRPARYGRSPAPLKQNRGRGKNCPP